MFIHISLPLPIVSPSISLWHTFHFVLSFSSSIPCSSSSSSTFGHGLGPSRINVPTAQYAIRTYLGCRNGRCRSYQRWTDNLSLDLYYRVGSGRKHGRLHLKRLSASGQQGETENIDSLLLTFPFREDKLPSYPVCVVLKLVLADTPVLPAAHTRMRTHIQTHTYTLRLALIRSKWTAMKLQGQSPQFQRFTRVDIVPIVIRVFQTL